MQDSVAAEPVAVVGILKAGHYLVYPLAEHLRLAVYHHRLPAGILDKSTVTFLPATGSSSNNVGKVW